MHHASSTIEYYNKNADTYFERTVKIDMKTSYKQFLDYLPEKAEILDAGSGSGRDTKYFLDLGYKVVAIDASVEMVKKSSEYCAQQTLHRSFQDIDFSDAFDGIWCSASLLHVPADELMDIFIKIKRALRVDGVWFMSFYSGSSEIYRGERFYHDMTTQKLSAYLEKLGDMKILELQETASLEKGSTITWIHCIAQKQSEE